jgi:hypothetical protein
MRRICRSKDELRPLTEVKVGHESRCVAVMVEPRKHRALEFVLRNVREGLGSHVPIVIMYGLKNEQYVQSRVQGIPNLTTIQIPYKNLDRYQYAQLCCSLDEYWDHFKSYEWLLKFEVDSMMCLNSPYTLGYFMDLPYDYFGAPWQWFNKQSEEATPVGGNGGFSLRRVKPIMESLSEAPFPTDRPEGEDLYISGLPNVRCPPLWLARLFSVESMSQSGCLGVHKPWMQYQTVGDWERTYANWPAVSKLYELNH